VGEAYLDDLVRKLFMREGIKYLPPGALKGVDYVLSGGFVFFELEDTVKEAYNALKQMEIKALKLAFMLKEWVVIGSPFPQRPSQAVAPIVYVLNETARRRIAKREFWLFDFEKDRIIRIADESIGISPIRFRTIEEKVLLLKSNEKHIVGRKESEKLLNALKNLARE